MAKFRRRYSLIDHENANAVEVGPVFALFPAKNHADLAALKTLIENVEPELAAELQAFHDEIVAHPHRGIGTYGKECLPYITHPDLVEHAQERLDKLNEE